ncbi:MULTISPECIES: toll/interleukin-1 receptor domain-containing protein [Amycolatopsis]|uniref:toll/interleukin-1 receptor domain-containing protein n=1 Tax=Amycolatopsis TaxID=1813 RepID=UPI0031F98CBB
MTIEENREHDVCLSFAGEQREYVDKLAALLKDRGVRIFYDNYEIVNLWGKDLYEHLDWVYRKSARYCIMFISEDYAKKVWTNHERKSAQARALQESAEYVLPVKFDETEIPGLRPTISYVDARKNSPEQLADLIAEKLGPRQLSNFYPPTPDRLFKEMGLKTKKEKDIVDTIARSFRYVLERMDSGEREVVVGIMLTGCRMDLPKNLHIETDLLRRNIEMPPAEIIQILDGLRSLGFKYKQRPAGGKHSEDLIELEWRDHSAYRDVPTFHFASRYSTKVAYEMLQVAFGDYCVSHAQIYLDRMDFSALSTQTFTPEDAHHNQV